MSLFFELDFNKIKLEVDIEFYIEFDFVKIEVQFKGILLNSFKTMTLYYIIFKLWISTHSYY